MGHQTYTGSAPEGDRAAMAADLVALHDRQESQRDSLVALMAQKHNERAARTETVDPSTLQPLADFLDLPDR